jgi:hypothetical protein
MRVKIEVTIAATRIADLLEVAVRGYWVDEITPRFGKGAAHDDDYMLADYSGWVVAALTPHSEAVIEVPCNDGGGFDLYCLDRDKIAVGLTLLSRTQHWQDFMEGNEDGTTGDVFMQLCLFGEVVFG